MLYTTTFFKRFIATTLFAVLASPSLLLAQDLEIIVPAYANPGSDTNEEQGRQMWTDLIATSAQVGDKLNVILNPGNGPGGDQIDLNYIHDDPTPPPFPDFGSAPLVETRAGGADIYGYVATGFGPTGNADAGNPGRSLADVLADIEVGSEPRTGVASEDFVWIPVLSNDFVAQLSIADLGFVGGFGLGLSPDTPSLIDGALWVPAKGSDTITEISLR